MLVRETLKHVQCAQFFISLVDFDQVDLLVHEHMNQRQIHEPYRADDTQPLLRDEPRLGDLATATQLGYVYKFHLFQK